MSMEWITHRGKRILYIDYGGLSQEEELKQIEDATKALVETNDRNNLTLSDLSRALITQEFVVKSKEMGKVSKDFTKKAAVVGVEGVRRILLRAVNAVSGNPRVPFSTVEEAKDWLARE